MKVRGSQYPHIAAFTPFASDAAPLNDKRQLSKDVQALLAKNPDLRDALLAQLNQASYELGPIGLPDEKAASVQRPDPTTQQVMKALHIKEDNPYAPLVVQELPKGFVAVDERDYLRLGRSIDIAYVLREQGRLYVLLSGALGIRKDIYDQLNRGTPLDGSLTLDAYSQQLQTAALNLKAKYPYMNDLLKKIQHVMKRRQAEDVLQESRSMPKQ